jgi:hypothetical protein
VRSRAATVYGRDPEGTGDVSSTPLETPSAPASVAAPTAGQAAPSDVVARIEAEARRRFDSLTQQGRPAPTFQSRRVRVITP